MNMSFGSRLREERARLGLRSSQVAEIARISRRRQAAYESDLGALGSAYLRQIASAGFDIQFVITGRRNITRAGGPQMSERHLALLVHYDQADAAGKEKVDSAARLAVEETIRDHALHPCFSALQRD